MPEYLKAYCLTGMSRKERLQAIIQSMDKFHYQFRGIHAAWQGDGFYYSAYDAPAKGKEFSNVNEKHKIYYHKIGEPQSKDKLIYQNPAYPKRFYTASTSEDERILFLTESGAACAPFSRKKLWIPLCRAVSPLPVWSEPE